MKLTKLTALVAGMGLAATAGTASAFSLGEVWVGDQNTGELYIFDQGELNDPSVDAVETKLDLTAVGSPSTRMHLIGFTNHSGLDPNSRAHLAYLNGTMDIMATNGGTHAPTVTQTIQVSSSSLHMCGGNPANTEITCSSIGQKQLVKISQDPNGGDTSAVTGYFPIAGLTIDPSVGGKAKSAINKEIRNGILAGAPICNNYSTDGALTYVTVKGANSGVLVLDTGTMAIRDAFGGTAVGCGLVNSQDGTAMWTNAGSKSTTDSEGVYKWNFADAYDDKATGPVASIDLPDRGQGGDVHGAQFAGLGGPFLWEVMRLDDAIHVVDPGTATVVNTIDLETEEVANPAADVLDRSAFGTRMYASLRGAIPTTAITGNNDPNRTPGVMVIGTIFGYSGVALKTESILSGNVATFCPDHEEGDGDDDDHAHFELCDDTHEHWDDRIEADTADPHGLKSLNYTSGGF